MSAITPLPGLHGDAFPFLRTHAFGQTALDGWSTVAATEYVLAPVRAVLPGRVLDGARVVVRDGRICEVATHRPGVRANLDGRGMLCLPGLVDVHSDALVRACQPRPGAQLPIDFALSSTEAALLAAGVTTVFHGVGFQTHSPVGLPIASPGASEVYDAVVHAAADTAPRIDHRVLHRLDIRCRTGWQQLRQRLDEAATTGALPLVSHEDHTPGQGQYADPATMRRWLVEAEQMTAEQAANHVDQLARERDQCLDVRVESLDGLAQRARAGQIRLACHDPATGEEVAEAAGRGVTVAEFPTTRAAAVAAQESGQLVVAGAPNVLRGQSHSGNVSATELIAEGLVDALASDYLPSALLGAVHRLVHRGVVGLAEAVQLITAGPARVAGLTDRGALRAGLRADLVLADVSGSWPKVGCSLRAL